MRRDLRDLEAFAAQHLAERLAREVDEVHLHVPGPPLAKQLREDRLDVHRRDGKDAARTQRTVDRANVECGIGQVLDDIPKRDYVVAAVGQRRVLDCAAMHVAIDPRVRDLGTPARRLNTRNVKASVLREREEGADVATHVEQVS